MWKNQVGAVEISQESQGIYFENKGKASLHSLEYKAVVCVNLW